MEFHEGLARVLLDEFPMNVALLDHTGEIIWVNRAWREYGRERGLESDTVGSSYLEVTAAATGDPYADRVEVGLRELLDAGEGRLSIEYPCHGPDELRWFVMQATVIELDGRTYCLTAHEDITGRKKVDLLTEARRAEAAALNRMLTHEVRNAVGSAVGWLELLRTEPDQADRIGRIATALDRVERAVEDSTRVLELARVYPTFERSDIEDLATTAWERSDRDGIDLEIADRFPVICYPEQTVTLLETLFDDASTSAADHVRIRLGRREFYVEDDRPVPVPATPERAFGESTVRHDGRLSFGLSLAHPLALMNGWQLSLQSSPLGGWQFTIRTDQYHA